MFQVKIKACSAYNMQASVPCLNCGTPIVKAFWEDTPVRNLYARCLMCSEPIPDYESLLRNQKARIYMHFTKMVPTNKAQGILGY